MCEKHFSAFLVLRRMAPLQLVILAPRSHPKQKSTLPRTLDPDAHRVATTDTPMQAKLQRQALAQCWQDTAGILAQNKSLIPHSGPLQATIQQGQRPVGSPMQTKCQSISMTSHDHSILSSLLKLPTSLF